MPLVRQRQPGVVSMISTEEESLRPDSKKVPFINDEVREVVRQMEEAALDWENGTAHKGEIAIAMAAVQIGRPLKICIVRANPQDKTPEFNVYINPKIVKYEGKKIDSVEGCLSLPGIYARVPRWSNVRVRANNLEGKLVKFRCDGLLANVLQHETDHFHGKLFTDHVERKDWLRLDDLLKEFETDKKGV
jgi:peptide deformylase